MRTPAGNDKDAKAGIGTQRTSREVCFCPLLRAKQTWPARTGKKKDGLRSEAARSFFSVFQSDLDDRDDPVVAIDDDDLITNDEVQVPAPLRMDLDERRGNLHHPHAGFPACQTLGSSYNGGTCV